MPSASDELNDLMAKWFPAHEVFASDHGPIQFLLSHGWTEQAGMWFKPVSAYNPSIYEVMCLKFLRDEWDYDWHEPLFQEDLA